MNTLGSRIALQRNIRHWTQDKLASDLGIAQGMLSDIENNKVSPKWDMINKIAAILEISVLELLPLDKSATYQAFRNTDTTVDAEGTMQMLMEALLRSKDELLRAKEETIMILKQRLSVK